MGQIERADAPYAASTLQGLSDTGYVAGQNVAIEYRWADGRPDRLPALAAELVGGKVDVIIAPGGARALAAKNATSTIPIVFTSGDPFALGLVTSLARPEGNLTGISLQVGDLTQKRLELLSEMAPQARVVALLLNPNNVNAARIIEEVQAAARVKGLRVDVLMGWEQARLSSPAMRSSATGGCSLPASRRGTGFLRSMRGATM